MELTPQIAEFLRDQMLHDLENEHKSTLGVIAACPEPKLDFKPHEKCMTFAAQAVHIYGAGLFFCNMIDKQGVEKEEPVMTAAGLAAQCGKLHADFVRRFGAMDGPTLVKKYDFLGMCEEPGITLMRWHHVHLVHHRAQMSLYLRLMGEKCPSIYGPSADVPMS